MIMDIEEKHAAQACDKRESRPAMRTPTPLNEELVEDCFFEAIISTEQIFDDLAKHRRFDLADVYLERLETLLENVQLVIDDARPE